MRGVAYREERRSPTAPSSDYNAAIKFDPKNTVAFNNLGNAYQRKGGFDRAISDYDEAIKLDPKNAFAFGMRGNTYKEKGDLRPRHQRLRRGHQTQFRIRGCVQQCAAAHIKEKSDFDRAISDYDAAIKLNSKYAAAFNNRGIAYAGERRHSTAPSATSTRPPNIDSKNLH